MKTVSAFSRTFLAIAGLALGATQLSCSVNDYCLNCGTEDAGSGSNGDANDAGEIDAPPDAGCIPTNGGEEECDGEDNDCNGLIDDGTLPQSDQPCDNQVGACTGGVKFCEGGVYKCTKTPSPEECDGVDNDCNGTIDNGDPGGGAKCGTDMGECQAGTKRCVASVGCDKSPTCDVLDPNANCCLICENFVDHRTDTELCNGKDDNCNGTIDENLTNLGACTWPSSAGTPTNEGACNIGTQSCQGGNPVCSNAVYPKFEVCNTVDDDCDTGIDEIFNKNIDPLNCGTCNNICQPVSKTCTAGTNVKMACATDADCPGSTLVGRCAVNSQPCCGPACAPTKPNQANGTCAYKCNVGFIDLNTTASDGCEYKCSPTGNEECDGADNDCDGRTDEGLTVPTGLCLTQGVCAGSVPVCMQAQGWKCNYPTTYEPGQEVSCDNLNNDCDANIDENPLHLNKGQVCDDGQNGICRDVGTLGCNTADTDGALVCLRTGESGTQCDNNTDDNADGLINEGCPTVGTPETGSQCANNTNDDASGTDTKVNDGCPQGALGSTPAGTETCNAKDDDCDGNTDEGSTGAGTALDGRDWVDIGNGKQMMKYEASRPDAAGSNVGINNSTVCSRPGVLPWVNVTYGQAQLACAAVGAELCTEQQWHRACSVIAPSTYPVGASTGSTLFIEAEDYSSIAYSPGGAETTCTGAADDDGDGRINDGCVKVGTFGESNCVNNVDDDLDGAVNDGCPAVSSTMYSWVSDYTSGFSGISSMEATPNTSAGNIAIGSAAAQSPRMDYLVNFTQAGTYHVWVKLYNFGVTTSDTVYVGVNAATPPQTPTGTASPTVLACTSNANCTAQPGTVCTDTDASGALDTCVGWVWADAGTFTPAMGNATVSVFMGDDGAKVDKIAVTTSATAPVDTLAGKGFTWAYETNQNTYQPTTCNGADRVAGDSDPVIASGTLAQCHANTGTNIFDMSGNVKEWTAAHLPGENPIRGGASNNTGAGISCPLNFTLADDTFFFPNIGFRCCK